MTIALKTRDLKSRADEVAALLKTLSHSNRLLIACELTGGERSVSALEEATGVPQPHLSRELSRLRAEGLVVARRDGKMVHYRLVDRRLEAVIGALCAAFGPGGAKSAAKGGKR